MPSHCDKVVFVRMPRKPWYNIIREPPKDVGTNADTEETTVGSMTRGAQISQRTETRHHDEVADHQLEDEDYDPEADEVPSFDDHIDDLFATQEAEDHNNNEKRKDTDYWEVIVIEDGMRKVSKLSVKEAIALPSNTKIIFPFNKVLQPIGQVAGLLSGFLRSLGADYSHFPIYEESWKHVNKAKKEHAYDMIKRVFHYEDDAGGKIKQEIMQRIGKNWKDTRHNLYHKFYKETRTLEENLKHRPSGIEENHWKWFLEYRQKEETKEKDHGRPVGRGELFIITHKKKMARISIPMRVLLHLSQNDSLAQVLGKEHPGRVRALGEPNEEYERRIVELMAKIEEEQVKRQSIKKVLGYLIQQQGGNLPADVATELDYLGNTPTSSRARPSSSGNHDSQQK
ncbi:hypothetical protein Ahy_B08g090026 [Arachis hypogaea]|uniref:Transposase, Ptta/En/Spm, plant n=1 Tax=Arachis hypogaea TaxID=3818 RepID=A0A444XZD2_ARAHY|nr:hypothetical protein Ahy_B08g090026 [Arachis hypogaea]